jgi:hypothetical protein
VSVRRFAVVAATFGALALTSCGGDPTEASPDPSPSPSASASPSPTEPALAREVMAEPPQRPEDEKTPAGAEQFAAYVVEAYYHGAQQRDFSLISSLTKDEGSCKTCRNTEEAVKKAERDGRLQLMTKPVKILDSTLLDKKSWVVGVTFHRAKVDVINDKGEKVDSFPGRNDFIEMGLEWHGGTWTLYNLRFGED